MAALEVIALDTVTPQLRAPGAGDTYTFPRAVEMTGALTYGGVTLNNAVTGTGDMVLSVSPILAANSSSPALTLTQTGTGPVLLLEDSTSPDATPTAVDANGNLIFAGTARTSNVTNAIEMNTTANNAVAPRIVLTQWSATQSLDANLMLRHFPSGTIGTYAVNASGDNLGQISWLAYSSVSPSLVSTTVASIRSTAQSASTANLTLYTTAGLTIDSPAGAYTLPSGDGTSSQVLQTDGAGNVSWQTVGGGSATLTIQNKTGAYTVVAGDLGTIINCTSGTFTVALTAAATLGAGFNCWIWNTGGSGSGVITIDPNASETIDGQSTLSLRRGEGTQIICDGTNWQTGDKKTMRAYSENIGPTDTRASASFARAVAIGSASVSSGNSSIALGANTSATSNYSSAIGANSAVLGSQTVTGAGSMALSGSYASGTDSFAAAVANNTSSYGATGANSVAVGYRAKATGSGSIAIGYNCSSTNASSVVFGTDSAASGGYSTVLNGTGATDNGLWGKFVIGSGFNAAGQTGIMHLRESTTNATATVLKANGGAVGTTNQVILPNSSAYAFSGIIVARQQASGGTASAAWKIEGLIRREANAASTVLVNSALTTIDNTPGWTLALSADTTNGGLAITVTGAAATNIRWLATVQTSEVTYA